MSDIKDFVGISLNKKVIEDGICNSGVPVQMNSEFAGEPIIILTPSTLPCYSKNSSAQGQTITIDYENLQEYDTNKYEFTPKCDLVVSGGVGTCGGTSNSAFNPPSPHGIYTPESNLSSGVKSVSIYVSASCHFGNLTPYWINYIGCDFQVRLECFVNGSWINSSWSYGTTNSASSVILGGTKTITSTYDITKVRAYAYFNYGSEPITSYLSVSLSAFSYQLDGYSALQSGSLSYMAIGDKVE